jgi:hypothetical protein
VAGITTNHYAYAMSTHHGGRHVMGKADEQVKKKKEHKTLPKTMNFSFGRL